MAYTNFVKRNENKTRISSAIVAMLGLLGGGILIIHFMYIQNPVELVYISGVYLVLTVSSFLYAKQKKR
jgi:lipid-A-disaccharide synthase-like uncharacterized protein